MTVGTPSPADLGTGAMPGAGTRPVSRLALVGMPGTGKSSVARVIARRRGWRVVDLDEEVAGAAATAVTTLFALEGEAGFRQREAAALRSVLATPGPLVLACGGGTLTAPGAVELVGASCTVVWLDAADSVLLGRLGAAEDRPLLAADPAGSLAALRAERHASYAATAMLRVDAGDGDVEDVADRVEDAIAGVRLGAGATPRATGARRVVTVDVGDRSYPVVIGTGRLAEIGALLPDGTRRVAVVADRAVIGIGRGVLAAVRSEGRHAGLLAVRGGEALKTWGHAGRLVAAFSRMRLDRGDCVIAVGGGTVGDTVGFAAASYLRGIAVVHVPTTLLAMVDSSVGGKTGVNLPRGKNLAGAFWQPHGVLCDLDVLRTLGRRAYLAAFAEIVKYSMILDDAELLERLDRAPQALLERDPDALGAVIERCCDLKARVVGADEREAGLRAILNYGHTVGHALEAVTGYGTLLHGEAVAAGMRVAGRISVAHGCPAADVARQDELLATFGLGEVARTDPASVLARTGADKKASAGRARWVLLERRGRAVPGHLVDEAVAMAALTEVVGG